MLRLIFNEENHGFRSRTHTLTPSLSHLMAKLIEMVCMGYQLPTPRHQVTWLLTVLTACPIHFIIFSDELLIGSEQRLYIASFLDWVHLIADARHVFSQMNYDHCNHRWYSSFISISCTNFGQMKFAFIFVFFSFHSVESIGLIVSLLVPTIRERVINNAAYRFNTDIESKRFN